MKEDKKKVYLKNFGCQMNVYDSEQVMRFLEEKGYEMVSDNTCSDIILFNTCSVRRHAEERVFGRLTQLKQFKKNNPHSIIGVMGCMVNAYKNDLLKDFPHVDFISGTNDFARIPEILDEIIIEREQRAYISERHRGITYSTFLKETKKIKAFVPIMRGCDNYCSFCIVPYVRGREISRDNQEIIDEITFLSEHGVKEIMLLGQNVNSYGKGMESAIDFPELLNMVSDVKGIEIIRFMTSHPKDISQKLYSVMKDNDKIEKHLHLPLQSGSDRILKAMNRNYTINEYRDKVSCLKKLIPSASITTDIIVGFCGEKESDYGKTKSVMNDIQFDNAFIFKYSPRQGTRAYTLRDDVSQKNKMARNNELLHLQKEITLQKNKLLIGKTEQALVEGLSKKDSSYVKARTWSDKEVVFKGAKDLIGKVVSVKLDDIRNETFVGTQCI